MTTAQMRAAVHDAYPSKAWKTKVNNMPDIQVQAIYLSMSERGFFNKNKPAKTNQYGEKLAEPLRYEPYIGEQLSMF